MGEKELYSCAFRGGKGGLALSSPISHLPDQSERGGGRAIEREDGWGRVDIKGKGREREGVVLSGL